MLGQGVKRMRFDAGQTREVEGDSREGAGWKSRDTPLLQAGSRGAAADHELVGLAPPLLHVHLQACKCGCGGAEGDRTQYLALCGRNKRVAFQGQVMLRDLIEA